jgi:hypothetical protein
MQGEEKQTPQKHFNGQEARRKRKPPKKKA